MKNVSMLVFALLASTIMLSQPTGYYNGTDGKNGEELKSALNDIIKGHTVYSYFFSKEVFKLSDADPNNPDNVIQVYTGFSHDNSDYGSSGLTLNREHVWAKSHGEFTDVPPMYSDVHNLKPSASTVNQSKSNLDFDNGGVQHPVATGCYYTDSTWEPRDEVKGDIARIIFYMATRYEGEDGELDLEVADNNHTYPLPQHGKLSTLLTWNQLDPPDEFERNRNNVIYSFQKNRNPFIDNPEFVQLIWGDATANPVVIDEVLISPEVAVANQPSTVTAQITSNTKASVTATLYWGASFENLPNEIAMTDNGNQFSCQIPGQPEDATTYYKIVATDGENENSTVVYNFYTPKVFSGTIVSIYDIQGQQESSPYDGQVVSTTGVVTGNFGANYYIQDGTGGWNGLFIYESGRNPSIGDSIVITGKITEYYGKTEMSEIEDYYFISANNQLPEPVQVKTGEVEEQHESILITVKNAECTDDNYQADYFMWKINDGTGVLKVHNTAVFEYEPVKGSYYDVTGPLNYDFDEWKIELRFESDVTDGGDTEGPEVVEVVPVISTNIRVMFDEDVESTTAQNPANYLINNGVMVESVLQHAFNKAQVNLTITPLSGDYELTIQNVEDTYGNVMQTQVIPFSYVGIEEQIAGGEVSVFPNPASGNLAVSFEASETFNFDIVISDIAGRQLVKEKHVAKQGLNKLNYDVTVFGKGIYLLNLNSEKGSLNYKVLVR